MEKPVLSDKNQFPTEEIIYAHLDKTKKFWESLFNKINTTYPEFNPEWRYYNDGKSWLLKVTQKAKTVLWVAVFDGYFKTTFYFGGKAEPTIMNSNISDELKDQYKNGKRYGKIRSITKTPRSANDVHDVISLIELKLKIK